MPGSRSFGLRAAALLIACGLPLSGTGPAMADDIDWRDVHQRVESGEYVPLATVLDWLEARYVGQVIEVEMEREDGIPVYEVEMVGPQGQVVEFEFDAADGSLIGIDGTGLRAMERQ
ncbi:PepSY domain-containing protein [Algiphilus sp.]|uniref:PepSY domain-containing protein n=1 Tax=Algiphilus sp. TaxID=1872431 RepID=UPI003C3A0084